MNIVTDQLSASCPAGWRDCDWDRVKTCETLDDLSGIAYTVLNHLPRPTVMLCGPILNGERREREKYIGTFNRLTELLCSINIPLFNQAPLQPTFFALIEKWKTGHVSELFCEEFLESFYGSILKFPGLKGLIFLPDWERSMYARWQYDRALRLQKAIITWNPTWETWDDGELRNHIRHALGK